MSVCGQTEEESASEDGAPVREMSEAKAVSKVVRVLTVLAYLLSVSLAAILLSVYYVCVWQSPKLPPLNDTGEGQPAALRAGPAPNSTAYNTTSIAAVAGGGDTTVSEAPATPPLDSLPASTEPPDPYAPPPDPYTQNSIYNATHVNITDPWPTWIMATVNDTGQR